jgi:large subunit ribosomal protein L4
VTESSDENLHLASRNLYRVETCVVSNLDPVRLIKFDKVLVTVAALKKLEVLLL